MTTTTRPSAKGVSQMTRAKHNFEGFAVRKQADGLCFHRYVSASPKAQGLAPLSFRRAQARAQAKNLHRWLCLQLATRRNYHNGELTQVARHAIEAQGFKIAPYSSRKQVA